jgi:cobalt-zinc-cadmium efflux system protein
MTAAHAQHTHATQDSRRLAVALGIAVCTFAVEVVGGLVTGSLALLADAGHVLSDGIALGLAWLAVWLATRPHSLRFTFGLHRAEVLAASANAMLVLVFSVYLAFHAVDRLFHPQPVEGVGLALLAAVGLVANGAQLMLLHGGTSMNLEAARLHVWGDLGGSVAALAAGVIVATTGWLQADAVLTLVILAIVSAGGVRMLFRVTGTLMAATPAGVDLEAVQDALRGVPGVREVHDMHCWAVATDFVVFEAHVLVNDAADGVEVVAACSALLSERFGIQHAAIHPERRPLIQVR